MEAEEENLEIHPCKRSRIVNGSGSSQQNAARTVEDGGGARLRDWNGHASSRIIRVSRASGGKDRHSKVLTARGLRDRRVRLSVSTAIQFYDLQDRLGFDQPSKAVEWLINAASAEIDKLPALDCPFPELPKLLKASEEKLIVEAEAAPVPDLSYDQHHVSLNKSGCSSTSDSSKGSVLSLSQSGMRVSQKDKRRDFEDIPAAAHHHAVHSSLNSQGSFTELLTSGVSNVAQENPNANLPLVTADYFSQAAMFQQHAQKSYQQQAFSKQIHFGSNPPLVMVPFNVNAADHPEMQQISFMSDYLIPVAAVAPGGDYNLNFGLAGFNRGTLQSNSAPQLPNHHNLQRLLPVRGSNLPFGAAPVHASNSSENQFPGGFDGSLQLYDGDLKGKGRS